MQRTLLIGLFSGIALIVAVILKDDGAWSFFDLSSVAIVVGGTGAAILVSYTAEEIAAMPSLIWRTLTFRLPSVSETTSLMAELSRTARRDGLLALDRRLDEIRDEYTRTALELAIDGIDVQEIDAMLQERTHAEIAERQIANRVFNSAGSFAPAFGMIGTLIGLIQMLRTLHDPSQIGSGMAVALVTTFYGAVLANLIFLPMASVIRRQNLELLRAREMVRISVISIVNGETPLLLQRRLQMFLYGQAATEPVRLPSESTMVTADEQA